MEHQTDVQLNPGFWRSLLSAPNLVALAIALVGIGVWYQSQREQIAGLTDRVVRLESRVDQEATNSALVYMRRDNMALELAAIREEQSRIREQLQLLRRDLK